MTERDIRTIENMARTGIEFDDLCNAFKNFPLEEIEKIYMRIRKERFGSRDVESGIKTNCS